MENEQETPGQRHDTNKQEGAFYRFPDIDHDTGEGEEALKAGRYREPFLEE